MLTKGVKKDATLKVHVVKAQNVFKDGDEPDSLVKLKLEGNKEESTKCIDNNPNPEWDEEKTLKVVNKDSALRVEVWDKDTFFDDCLGFVEVKLTDLLD